MSTMASNIVDKMKNITLSNKKNLNIILLGETGVGKSTFINSIFNYLHFPSFRDAKMEKTLKVLIPSSINVVDKHKARTKLMIGNDDNNEQLKTGESATQDVKTYVFETSERTIRLIDTPGMGDTRGSFQDESNCESILDYIGKLTELHAICFLFKSKNTRITVYFEYCLTQILSRLDKSAKDSLIFVFTNTRGDDYSPGETYSILQEILTKIKQAPPNVDIPLKENLFCFDNEGFRTIAALKEGVEFEDHVIKTSIESWAKSRTECLRMIEYINKVKPHHVRNTACVNEARRMIVNLSQPLADIAQLINDNIYRLDTHRDRLELENASLEELRENLYMPVINLKETTMTQPATVCTSRKCADIYDVGGRQKWHYKQRCHDPCFLTTVPDKVIGAPQLANCASMNQAGMCKKCSCSFNIHQHIYYMTKTVEDKVINENVNQNITSKLQALRGAHTIICQMEDKKAELEMELKTIIDCNAKFAHFLQNNAITPFSDSYQEYIVYLIEREKSLGTRADKRVISELEKMKQRYAQMKNSFDEALKLSENVGISKLVTPTVIQDSIQELYNLKHMGKKIKKLYEMQKNAKKKEHEYSEHVEHVSSKTNTKSEASGKDRKKYKMNTKGDSSDKDQKKQQKGGNQRNQNYTPRQQQNQGSRSWSPPPSYSPDYRHPYPSQQPQSQPPPYYHQPYGPDYNYRPHDYRGPYGTTGYGGEANVRQDDDKKEQKSNIEVHVHLSPDEEAPKGNQRYSHHGPSHASGYPGQPHHPPGYYPPHTPPAGSGYDPYYRPPPPHSGYYAPPSQYGHPTPPGPSHYGHPTPPGPSHYGSHPPPPAYYGHGPPPPHRGGYPRSYNPDNGPHPPPPHATHQGGRRYDQNAGNRDQQKRGAYQQRGRGNYRGGRIYKNKGFPKGKPNTNNSDSDNSTSSFEKV